MGMQFDIKGMDLTKDLKGKTKVFEFASMPISVTIDVDADKKFDSLMHNKLVEAGKARIDEIIDIFTTEMIKIDGRVSAAMIKDPDSVNVAQEQKTAETMGKQIVASMQGHVQKAIENVFAQLKAAHKELIKFRVKCAVKIAWSSVKISIAAARLGASHGADVTAYIQAGKEIYAIGVVVYELAKSADTVQKEVGTEVENLIKAAAKAKKETNGIVVAARQLAQVEPQCKKVEGRVEVLKVKVTGVDEKSHGLAGQLDKLIAAADKNKGKMGKAEEKNTKLLTKAQGLHTKIHNMQIKVNEMTKYVAAVELFVDATRKDYTKTVAGVSKVADFLTKCKEVYDTSKDVIDTIKDIVSLVA